MLGSFEFAKLLSNIAYLKTLPRIKSDTSKNDLLENKSFVSASSLNCLILQKAIRRKIT